MAVRKTEVTERNVLTVRLPAELHDDLRAYKLFAGESINDLVVRLISEFLAGPGHEQIARGMTERARQRYGAALNKLANM